MRIRSCGFGSDMGVEVCGELHPSRHAFAHDGILTLISNFREQRRGRSGVPAEVASRALNCIPELSSLRMFPLVSAHPFESTFTTWWSVAGATRNLTRSRCIQRPLSEDAERLISHAKAGNACINDEGSWK